MRKFDNYGFDLLKWLITVITTIIIFCLAIESQNAKSVAEQARKVMTTIGQTMTSNDKVSQTKSSHKIVEAKPTIKTTRNNTTSKTIAKNSYSYKYCTTSLNCREIPNTKSKILGTFNYNTKLKVYSAKNSWFLVEGKGSSGTTTKGYVYSKYLSSQKQPERTTSTFKKTELKTNAKERKVYIGTFKLTFYCHCSKCCGKSDGITASGARVQEGVTIATNQSEIPMGTSVYIEGFGKRVAQDTGGFGSKTIDVYVSSHSKAYELGVQYKKVYKLVKD